MADATEVPQAAELQGLTSVDTRFVAVVWSAEDERPTLVFGGTESFEAEGLLRAALSALSRANAARMELPDELIEDDEDEDDEDDED